MTDDDDGPPTVRVVKRRPGLTPGQLCLALGLPLPGSPEPPPPVKDLIQNLFAIGKPKWNQPENPSPSP